MSAASQWPLEPAEDGFFRELDRVSRRGRGFALERMERNAGRFFAIRSQYLDDDDQNDAGRMLLAVELEPVSRIVSALKILTAGLPDDGSFARLELDLVAHDLEMLADPDYHDWRRNKGLPPIPSDDDIANYAAAVGMMARLAVGLARESIRSIAEVRRGLVFPDLMDAAPVFSLSRVRELLPDSFRSEVELVRVAALASRLAQIRVAGALAGGAAR